MKKKTIIISLIAVIIVIIGIGIYLFPHKNNQADSQQTAPAPQVSSTQLETPQDQIFNVVYENKTYGFTLTFPASWKDYRVTGSGDINASGEGILIFGIKDQDDLFYIDIFTKSAWARDNGPTTEIAPGTLLAENSQYVFAWNPAQYMTTAVQAFINQTSPQTAPGYGESIVSQIIQTFTLVK